LVSGITLKSLEQMVVFDVTSALLLVNGQGNRDWRQFLPELVDANFFARHVASEHL